MPGPLELTMNPSTFQQVRDNMKAIAIHINESDTEFQEVKESVDQVKEDLDQDFNALNERLTTAETTITKITAPDPPTSTDPSQVSDVAVDSNGNMQVYGVTIVTKNATINTLPSAYIRDVTYELKQPSVIGLSRVKGFEASYVLVITFKRNKAAGESANAFAYAAQQIAVGANLITRTRTADASNTNWGSWAEPEGGKSTDVTSPTMPDPDAQVEGDIWYETLA